MPKPIPTRSASEEDGPQPRLRFERLLLVSGKLTEGLDLVRSRCRREGDSGSTA